MLRPRDNEDGDGIIALVKETADGLGRLISDHIKLARVEIVADAKEYGRSVALMTIAAVFVLVGYGFAWTAAALALARLIGAPLAFLAVAALHLVGGAIALSTVMRKLKKSRPPLDESLSEVNRSVATLSAQVAAARAAQPPR
jgi:hypothetical protein